MSLHGTKTHENLKEAFAGESQANRRYLWFAQKADIEGYPDEEVVRQGWTRYTTTDSLKIKRSDCMKKLIQIAQQWAKRK